MAYHHYYVNDKAQPSGEHEVHKDGCRYMPGDRHRQPLGTFENCHDAMTAAYAIYPNSDGCGICCRPCHTR